MDSVLAGLSTGLALIVAIGAQNAYVLRQGIRREHIGWVVLVCALSDVALIAAGTAGIGALVAGAPWLLVALRWGGAAYLLWFAYGAFRSARTGGRLRAADGAGVASLGRVLATTAALTWLNPHVYLDTVLMLGSVANSWGGARWRFAAGAGAASILWFTALGFGARALAPVLDRPTTWRVVDVLVGVVMVAVAVTLALGA